MTAFEEEKYCQCVLHRDMLHYKLENSEQCYISLLKPGSFWPAFAVFLIFLPLDQPLLNQEYLECTEKSSESFNWTSEISCFFNSVTLSVNTKHRKLNRTKWQEDIQFPPLGMSSLKFIKVEKFFQVFRMYDKQTEMSQVVDTHINWRSFVIQIILQFKY